MRAETTTFLLTKRHLLLVISILAVLLAIAGFLYYRYDEDLIRNEKLQELNAIGKLKIDQITQWQKQRFADANVITGSPFFVKAVEEFFSSRNDLQLTKYVRERLTVKQLYYEYAAVFISDRDGEILVSDRPDPEQVGPATKPFIQEAFARNKTVTTDFYHCSMHSAIHYDIITPIITDKNIAIAALILRVDPDQFLYPLIQSWPVPSKTAETYIVRKEGDYALILNELRHSTAPALSLRVPLTSKERAAAQAVLGYTGIHTGKDYRGVEVLAEILPIRDTPWFMVAKVDKSEIFSELYFRATVISLFIFALILLLGVGLTWVHHYRQRNIYRELFLTEKELSETHEEFRTTLYSIGDAVISTDIKGRVRHMNFIAEQLTGWMESDARGKDLEDIFHIVNEETGAAVENPVAKVLREGVVAGLANHTLLISKAGQKTPIADLGSPIRNEAGEIIGVVLVFRDQTAERETAKKIQEQNDTLQRIFDNIPVMIAYYDEIGRFKTVNRETVDRLGWTLEEWQTENILEKCYPDPLAFQEAFDFMIKKPGGWKDFKTTTKAGTIIDTSWTNIVLPDGASMGIGQDITERKRAEESLRESQESFKELFDEAPVCYHEIDNTGCIIRVNTTELKMLGYTAEEMLGQPVWKFIEEEEQSRQSVLAKLAGSVTPPQIYERSFKRKDGTIVPVLAEEKILKDDNDRVIKIRTTLQDTTERKRAEEALRESEKNSAILSKTSPTSSISPIKMESFSMAAQTFLRKQDIHPRKYWESHISA